MKGWGARIWCSCGDWWFGGDDRIAEHMRAHPRHVWWSEHYANDVPIGPPWPPLPRLEVRERWPES